MLSASRFALSAGMVAAASLLFPADGAAEMKFASEKVTEAAKVPNAAEALAARLELDAAFEAQDAEAVAALCAEDLIVNTPANRIADKEAVIGFLKMGRISYEDSEEIIEAVDTRGDQVVLMGEEVVKPQDATDNAGKIVHRRFTDVWRKESDGKWRLTIRQATITSVE